MQHPMPLPAPPAFPRSGNYSSFSGSTANDFAVLPRNVPTVSALPLPAVMPASPIERLAAPLAAPAVVSFSAKAAVSAQSAESVTAASESAAALPVWALDRSQRRFRERFGLLGLQLYDRAEEGHAEAAYQLGVMLCADRATAEGTYYLDQAKQQGHSGAAGLRRIKETDRLRQRSLKVLLQFATDAHTDNQLHTAVSYCLPAALNEDADAAQLLVTVLTGMQKADLARAFLRCANSVGLGSVKDAAAQVLEQMEPEPRLEESSDSTQPLDMQELFTTYAAEDHPAHDSAHDTTAEPPTSPTSDARDTATSDPVPTGIAQEQERSPAPTR
jgi:hypothetical protein